MKTILSISIFLIISTKIFAQPIGATINNPINVGTIVPGIVYTDTKNNATANGFGNDYGQPSDDIYYKFTLNTAAEVSISNCSSTFDTYLHVLDANGNLITSLDDSGPLCPGLPSSIKVELSEGIYYVVAEGYYNLTGNIITSIGIQTPAAEVDNNFSQAMTNVFSTLDLNRVPFGLLQDAALEQTELSNYKGLVLADSNRVDMSTFNAIYQTLVSARVNTSALAFTPIAEMESACFELREPGKIILSALLYRFSKFKDNALQANQITVTNSKIYDKFVNGVWQNPYQTEHVFAISPPTNTFRGLSQQIIIPTALSKSNSSEVVLGIDIDANDGLGYRNIALNTPLTVNYPYTGLKVLKFRLRVVGNVFLYSHSLIRILPTLQMLAGNNLQNPKTFAVTATQAFNGQFAEGFMTIKYANPALGLRKPLIVAEGFDPGNITSPEEQFGFTGFEEGFIDRIPESGTITNLLLNNPQYDIVYVDWKRGTDNIKKNAQLLKEVIRRVNTLKAAAGSTAKNVIIGQSMGGLITRWALKEMENAGENHQTNLFISYDTPHQGANLPLAYQFLARHVRNQYIKTGVNTVLTVETIQLLRGGARPIQALQLSNTSAARQMLVEYVNDFGNINNDVHNQWQTELKNMGYPQGFAGSPLRIIAVSNGTECANPQASAPGSSFLSFVGKGNTTFLGDIAGQVAFPIVGSLLNRPSLLLGALPGRNDFKFEIQLNATDNGGGNRVYYNKVSFTKRFLWLIPITVNITDKSNYALNGSLPYDSYPGGNYKVTEEFTSSSADKWLYKYNVTATQQPFFGFVPTTSALDIGRGNITLTAADYTTKYIGASPPTGSKSSPFANFITAFERFSYDNEEHLTIGSRNGNWVAAELNKASLGTGNLPVAINCTYMCNDVVITGPNVLCTNGTYSIPNVPIGTTIQWSTTGGIVITGSANSNSVTISSISNSSSANGIATLSVTTSASCGSLFRTKNITINNPNTDFTRQSQTLVNGGFSSTFTAINQTGATYEWKLDGVVISNLLSITITGGNCSTFPLKTSYVVQLKVTNSCNVSDINCNNYIYNCNSGFTHIGRCNTNFVSSNSNLAFNYYPNPANTELTVSYSPIITVNDGAAKQVTTLSEPENTQFEILLYDDKSNIINQQKNEVGTKEIKINTQNLPNGNYFLHILNGNQKIEKQIVIQH